MTRGAKPIADVSIDPALVRALLREQHADLAHLPLIDVGESSTTRCFSLGRRAPCDPRCLVAPLRRPLIEHEQRWLLRLAPRLPLPVPVPLRVGRPGCGFPWSWSVVPWLAGQSALLTPLTDGATAAVALGQFLRALHRPHRQMLHTTRGGACRWRWSVPPCEDTSSRSTASSTASPCSPSGSAQSRRRRGPGRLCGSTAIFTPAISSISGGRLSAVIDFGDLAAGDPATDLSVVWMVLPPISDTQVSQQALSRATLVARGRTTG